eukprot:scaffold7017_cov75-Phaeocystis_antarctica.AAC.14
MRLLTTGLRIWIETTSRRERGTEFAARKRKTKTRSPETTGPGERGAWTLTNIRYYNKVNMPSSRILAGHCLPGCCGRGAALLCWCTALVKGQYM